MIRGLGPIEALTQHQGEQQLQLFVLLCCVRLSWFSKYETILKLSNANCLVYIVVSERVEKKITNLRAISSEPSHITEENEGSEVRQKKKKKLLCGLCPPFSDCILCG